MKKKLSRMIAVLLGVLMLAVCVPAAAFADESDMDVRSATIRVGESWTMVVPGGNTCDWLLSDEYFEQGPNLPHRDGVLQQVGIETVGDMFVVTFLARKEGECTVTVTDRSFQTLAKATITVTGGGSTIGSDTVTSTVAAAPKKAEEDDTPAPVVDTRTAQQKEIDEAIANGTWGIEYTTCPKCGYHNWTRKGNVYVCDTCGNETTTVVSEKGVKGYVGSGAIAPVAGKAVPETRYATAQQAQAAADQREAAYAAAVAALQKQIAAREAAYLAAVGK